MALLPRQFNTPDNKETMSDFSAIPQEDCGVYYPMQIVKSSMEKCKPAAKDPNGQYLKLESVVLAGKYKGRKLWVQLNLINKNETAVSIAQKELNTICQVVGIAGCQNSEQLHGIPFMGRIDFVEKTPQYPAKNEIGHYKKMEPGFTHDWVAPAQTSQAAPAQQQGGQANQGNTAVADNGAVKKKPWE